MATNITFTANNESTEYSVNIGSRGPTGATGATGSPGPNTITTATTTPLVGFLIGNGATVTASTSATFVDGSSAEFGSESFAAFDSGSQAYFEGGSQAYFNNNSSAFFTSGSQAYFFNGTIKLVGTSFTSSLNFAAPTSEKTITLPDATGTVALTSDPRFTDARTPLAHTHVVSDIVSVASNRLLGRHAGGSGAGQEVTVGNGLEFQGSGIRREALTGDITASAGSNATTLAATIAGNKTFSGAMAITGLTTVSSVTETQIALGTVTTSATIVITSGTLITATLTASTACAFAMPTATAGRSFTLLLKQAAATGNGTATFTGVKFPFGAAPVITATAGRMDILTFVADGVNWYGSFTQNYTP